MKPTEIGRGSSAERIRKRANSRLARSENISVTISVSGRFHSFRLAEGLASQNSLDTLFTIYPKFKIPPYQIPNQNVHSFPLLGAQRFLGNKIEILKFSDEIFRRIFDRLVALNLKRPSGHWFFHGLNGIAENSLRRVKKLGGVAIVDRACPHIDFQLDQLSEERKLLTGRSEGPFHSFKVDKMKREYDIADYILVPSTYSLKTFLDRGFDPARLKTVPLCNEKITSRKPDGAEKTPFTVLCVAGDFFRKGTFYLLKAWKELDLPDAELVIKSTIPKEFHELLNIKNVRVISSHLSDQEISDLYQTASVFVLPSIDDGFGMAAVEAMGAGLPVLVTEQVGVSDGIENGKEGFVVPIRSISALRDKLKFFYDHPQRTREMGQAAWIKSQFYSPAAYTQRVLDTFERILKGPALEY